MQYSPHPSLAYPPEPLRSTDIEVDILITDIPRASVMLQMPFSTSFRLTIAAVPPSSSSESRIISLAVQHVQPPRTIPDNLLPPSDDGESFNSQLHFATSMTSAWHNENKSILPEALQHSPTQADTVTLPSPFTEPCLGRQVGVTFVGSSATFLPPFRISRAEAASNHQVENQTTEDMAPKVEATQDFELTYIPLQKGFVTIGGLRILLVEDKVDRGDTEVDRQKNVRILREWDVVAELWVKTGNN